MRVSCQSVYWCLPVGYGFAHSLSIMVYAYVIYGCSRKSREVFMYTTRVPDTSVGFCSRCKCIEVVGRFAVVFLWILSHVFIPFVFIFTFFSTLLRSLFLFYYLVPHPVVYQHLIRPSLPRHCCRIKTLCEVNTDGVLKPERRHIFYISFFSQDCFMKWRGFLVEYVFIVNEGP